MFTYIIIIIVAADISLYDNTKKIPFILLATLQFCTANEAIVHTEPGKCKKCMKCV